MATRRLPTPGAHIQPARTELAPEHKKAPAVPFGTGAFKALVRPGGFEPPARGLGNPCSIHLSYGRTLLIRFSLPPEAASGQALTATEPGTALTRESLGQDLLGERGAQGGIAEAAFPRLGHALPQRLRPSGREVDGKSPGHVPSPNHRLAAAFPRTPWPSAAGRQSQSPTRDFHRVVRAQPPARKREETSCEVPSPPDPTTPHSTESGR